MDKSKLSDLIAVVVIAGTGLLTAYITFGLLESQANADIQGYAVSGAIAGALVTMSLLATVYGQFRKSSGELEKLRSRNEELQQKLVRGAPRPPGFKPEVEERQKIVLARPDEWSPRGGVIFDFELDHKEMQPDDVVPSRFRLSYTLVTDDTASADKFYENYRVSVSQADYVTVHTTEYVYLGGEQGAVRSLKIIAQECAFARKLRDSLTDVTSFAWETISREQYQSRLKRSTEEKQEEKPQGNEPPTALPRRTSGLVPVIETPVMLGRMRVLCYHFTLKRIFQFDFIDDLDDFPNSSNGFNRLLDSVRFLT